jgi:hypothetical protein
MVAAMSSENLPKMIAAGAVAAFLALGAWTLGHAGSDSATTSAAAQGPPGLSTGSGSSGAMPPTGSGSSGTTPPTGAMPQGGAPGLGSAATGATASKVAKAATARYPGQVERVMQLSDGSYVAHVITSSGEVHVRVSKAFKVLGIEQGGPPQGVGPGGQAPNGTAPATPGGSGGSSSGSTGTQT